MKAHWEQFKRRVDVRINELKPEAEQTSPPKKNEPSAWAAESWEKARELGLLDGTRPRDAVTREELATVLVRLTDK